MVRKTKKENKKEQVKTTAKKAADTATEVDTEVIIQDTKEEAVEAAAMTATKADKKFELLGIAMFVFALIGVVATVYFAVIGIINLVSRKALKEDIQTAVYPLVVTDVPTFDDLKMLDSKTVVATGIWHFIMNEEDMDKYARDAYGTLTVPAVDIDVHIKQVFGEDVPITHQMIPDTEFYIPYDEETECYLIPENPQIMPYAPTVLDVSKQGGYYVAEIGYILPGPFWNVDENLEEEPSKTMVYTLEKVGKDTYIVISVQPTGESVLPESGEEVGDEYDSVPETENSGVSEETFTPEISDDGTSAEESSQ